MRVRPGWLWIWAAVVLGIAAVFAFDLTPWARGGFGWRWEYDPLPLRAWALPALLLLCYLLGAAALVRRNSGLRWAVAWSALFSVGLALAVTAAQEGDAVYGLFSRTVSKLATGPHWMSAHVDWSGDGWRHWDEVMRGAGGHLSNLPPGLPLGYAALAGLFGRAPDAAEAIAARLLPYQCHNVELLAYPPQIVASALFGVLMPPWAALAAVPLAAAARRLSGEQAARSAVLWWPLTPALLAFAGSLNTIFPLMTLLALLALLRAIDAVAAGRRLAWAVVGGLMTGAAIFANFAFAPLPLVLGLFALAYGLGVRRIPVGGILMLGAAFGFGAAIPWALFAAATGLTPLDLLRASFEFHLDLERPYAFWAVMHIWDWLVWGGLGLAALAIVSALRARRGLDGGSALSLALVVAMFILTLSGTARGETGRVWLVFTPLLVLTAADGLRRIDGRGQSWMLIGTVNGVFALVLAMSLPVVGTDLTPAPAPDRISGGRPADATFLDGGEPVFDLIAWYPVAGPGYVDVVMTFEPRRRATEPYYFGGVLVLPDGREIPSEAQQPKIAAGVDVPATCWAVGQPATVRFRQPVPSGVATRDAYISVAAYGVDEGEGPLSVETADGVDSQIGLGPVAVGGK
jgi:hypothetical protein